MGYMHWGSSRRAHRHTHAILYCTFPTRRLPFVSPRGRHGILVLTGSAHAVRLSRARWLVPIAMCAVFVGTCVLYFHALDSAPVVVAVDEARFALHAQSIVTHGTDL